VERHLTANEYWEREYNPRTKVPDAQKYFDAWVEKAANAREKLAGTPNLAYGEHPRERLDLFRAVAPRGTLVFIHGGYWRAFGREFQSWVAEAFVAAGISVAIPSYPLAPQATHAEIISSVSKVVPHLRKEVLTPPEQGKVVLVGHSAGGHLAACLVAAEQQVDAAVCISGLFDLAPLRHTLMLASMNWPAADLHAASPLFMAPNPHAKVLLAVGGDESVEFQLQSARLARAWRPYVEPILTPPGRNHFNVIDDLTQPDYELTRAIVGLFG
jgi:arylformamidase